MMTIDEDELRKRLERAEVRIWAVAALAMLAFVSVPIAALVLSGIAADRFESIEANLTAPPLAANGVE